MKSFFKWVGGKSRLISHIQKYIPANIRNYVEPFVGGGSMAMHMLVNYPNIPVIISDINPVITTVYITLQKEIDKLISTLIPLQKLYLNLDSNSRKQLYYKKRIEFNVYKIVNTDPVTITSLFLFLNRTCFNGLYRENSKREFNTPMGRYTTPNFVTEENLKYLSTILKNATILNVPFQDTLAYIKENTFVYLDPPYVPISNTSNFTKYYSDDFTYEDNLKLRDYIDSVDTKKGYFILSNNDSPVIREL